MKTVLVIGLAILAFAFIDRKASSMRRALKVRIQDNERRDR